MDDQSPAAQRTRPNPNIGDGCDNGQPRSRPQLLLYAMYDADHLDRGPAVRVSMMRAALERQCDLHVISGSRRSRALAALRWLASPARGQVDAVYVEAASSFATPVDLAFLGLMRLQGVPVGVYFRDAYQLFRNQYPLSRFRERILDGLWRISTPLLKHIATHRFVPSRGLASVLRIMNPTLLPPGTDPNAPFLGAAKGSTVAYVGAIGAADGLHLLIEAMTRVREQIPTAELLVISARDPRSAPGQPAWLRHERADRARLWVLLADARVCVIPRPITAYTDLAVPIKLTDYLSLGKPIVATACHETELILLETGAGLVVDDNPTSLAGAIIRVLQHDDLAETLAFAARRYAVDPEQTWDARARRVISALT